MAAMPTVVTTANTNSIDGVIGGSATPASTPAPKKSSRLPRPLPDTPAETSEQSFR
jgi:hypothetical protein